MFREFSIFFSNCFVKCVAQSWIFHFIFNSFAKLCLFFSLFPFHAKPGLTPPWASFSIPFVPHVKDASPHVDDGTVNKGIIYVGGQCFPPRKKCFRLISPHVNNASTHVVIFCPFFPPRRLPFTWGMILNGFFFIF